MGSASFSGVGANPLILIPTDYESSDEVVITSGDGAFGVWTEIIAATVRRSWWLTVIIHAPSTFNPVTFQIGTGTSTVLIPTISMRAVAAQDQVYPFLVEIASGTRIIGRAQSTGGTSGVSFQTILGGR